MSSSTALLSSLNESQRTWLLEHVQTLWSSLHAALSEWRQEMARCEKRMDDDYTDRLSKTDPDTADFSTIFTHSNKSLGMVSGFADFAYAQAKDDIFGGDEWLAVQPVGPSDSKLADQIRKHAPWKLEQCHMLDPLQDALRLAPNLGTAFIKVAWVEIAETYETAKSILVDKKSRKALADPQGQFITSPLVELPPEPAVPVNPGDGAVLAVGKRIASSVLPGKRVVHPENLPELKLDPETIEYRDHYVEETVIVKRGLTCNVIDYNDIAFKSTARSLDLCETPVFHRFKIGLLDAVKLYKLDEKLYHEALHLLNAGESAGTDQPREARNEASAALSNGLDQERENPEIVLIEGYLRCDPTGSGNPVRLHVVFSPEIQLLFTGDYLANVTIKGSLPIFPIRWWKTPNRITGRGYHTVFEDSGDQIDKLYNGVTWRDRFSNQPLTGYHRDALDNPDDIDGPIDGSKPFALKEGKTMDDLFDFASIPDNNNRSIELLNQMLQMQQMRSGITSASQGELKGVPQANTATGTNQIISRGAVLLKWPIDDGKEDIRRAVEYMVQLVYANQDMDETFAWGEGEAREIIELKADNVRDLDVDVTFAISQTQTQELMQNAQAAINYVTSYLAVPEHEKSAVRPLFVQALNCLGFRNAEQIIREPIQIPPGTVLDPATGQVVPAQPDPARMDAENAA